MSPVVAALFLLAAQAADPAASGARDVTAGIRAQIDDGWFAAAEAAAQAELERLTSVGSEASIEFAECLSLLADAMRRGGRGGQPETLGLAERAVELGRKLLPPGDPRLATALFRLGMLRSVRGEYDLMPALLGEALAIREKSFGKDHPEVAMILIAQANMVVDLEGDVKSALELLERAKLIQERTLPPGHWQAAWRSCRTATVLQGAGRNDDARASYEEARVLFAAALRPGHPLTALTLYDLGLLLVELGDTVRARELLEQALEMRIAIYGPEHRLVAACLRALADLHASLGQWSEARRRLTRALAIQEASFEPDSPQILGFAVQLARAALMDGAAAEAEKLLLRCNAACRSSPTRLGWLAPTVLTELAILRWDSGDLEQAKAAAAEAQELDEQLGNAHSPWILETRAALLSRTGDLDAAQSLLERAVAIREQDSGSRAPDLALTLAELARTRAGQGDASAALDLALRAESIACEHLISTARSFEQDLLLDYAACRVSGLDLALMLAVSQGAEARARVFDAVVCSRALVLDLWIDRLRLAHAGRDEKTARLVNELQQSSQTLATLLVRTGKDIDPARECEQIETARRGKSAAERALAGASSDYRRELERSRAGLAEIKAALPAGSALLSYVRSRENPGDYFAFVLRADNPDGIELVDLGAVDEIEALVARSVAAARERRPETEFRAAGAELRRRIWDPTAKFVEGVQLVLVVPDGLLASVDFASLPAGEDRYLIESAPTLHGLSAERDLCLRARASANGGGLLAMGGAAFDEEVPVAAAGVAADEPEALATSRARRFTSLPASAGEALQVAALWTRHRPETPALYLTGRDASEAAFKALAPEREVLHLATHGFFTGAESSSAGSSPMRGVTLPPSLAAPRPALPAFVRERPLSLSGLAFAGANQSELADAGREDGILTAEEVACVDLSRTTWAVLSACDTGLGVAHASEGVLGLRRAFLAAGVRTVIASLWAVDDQLARDFMLELHRARLERGLGTAQALRAVELEFLRRRRESKQSTEPATWAGFVAVGDWR